MKLDKLKVILVTSEIVAFLGYLLFILFINNGEYDVNIRLMIIVTLFFFVGEIVAIQLIIGKYFSPLIIFILLFYLFQNGQLLLYAFEISFNDSYLIVAKNHLYDITLFSSISALLAGFSGLLCSPAKCTQSIKVYKMDFLDDLIVLLAAKLGFIFTAIVSIPLILLKFIVFMTSGGYNAVRQFEGSIPSIIGFVEYFFIPFALLVIIYSQKTLKWVNVSLFFWLILTALCGDRTTGLGGLLVIFYLFYVQKKQYSKRNLVKLGIGVGSLVIISNFISNFRTQLSSPSDVAKNVLVSTLSEFGFSFFPLYTTMKLVPFQENYLMGKGYIWSFIGGWIPSFLDPSGIITSINQKSRFYEAWQNNYFFQYNFGFGYSLNAEAYANFGWWGLGMIWVLCLIICYHLSERHSKDSKWGMYKTMVLIFLWCTLPRRDSYYIWKAISYALILMEFYLLLMKNMLNKKTASIRKYNDSKIKNL